MTYIIGGFFLSDRSLWRLSQIHFIGPALALAAGGSHLMLLHGYGSQQLTGVLAGETDRSQFCFYYFKDAMCFGVVLSLPVIVLIAIGLWADSALEAD
jgi:quinol-cytochrome oxidoreductase complex cytochrome b subunit